MVKANLCETILLIIEFMFILSHKQGGIICILCITIYLFSVLNIEVCINKMPSLRYIINVFYIVNSKIPEKQTRKTVVTVIH